MERLDIALGSIGAIGGDCLESKWHLHVGQSADLKSGPGNDDLRRERGFRGSNHAIALTEDQLIDQREQFCSEKDCG